MNLGENNNFFRESFRGFNKDDVAEYIAKLSKDYAVNEERYKEHIAKLKMELDAKTSEISNSEIETDSWSTQLQSDEITQNQIDEINRLTIELNEKDLIINNLRIQLESGNDANGEIPDLTEIAKYQELIGDLTKEIEQLKEESEKPETISVETTNKFNQFEQNAEAVNQLSFQLAECESEKLFLLNLLKKFIYALDIESARGKNIDYAANITDIAPKAVISDEIDSGLRALLGLKDKTTELEYENAELKTNVEENKIVESDEQKIYESITADLGGIIYSAKKTAEDISLKAAAEAENIIGNAKLEADAIVGNAYAKKEAVIEENMKNMAEFKDKYGFIKNEFEDIIQKYKEISDNYMLHMSDIEGTINIIYDSINNEQ
ncbi:MAG: hypothetical protein FWF92_05255 [Oscillospiraceae bacterium]|nr:hypothetical protein [Oscillospiraceae bacterium]